MLENIKISICMATYNGADYIVEQLDSILPQLKKNDEVIISDDYSTDKTIDIIESYNDPRIKIYQNDNGKGPVKNFENAIKKASGDIIFLSDQDDIWIENKVSIMLEHFKKGYNLIVHNGDVFDNDTNVVRSTFFKMYKSNTGFIKNLFFNSYIGCCMAFDKDLKNKILPFPIDLPMHDSWIGLVAEKYFKVLFIKDIFIKYRYHKNNASFTATGLSSYGLMKKIGFRISLLKSLYKLK